MGVRGVCDDDGESDDDDDDDGRASCVDVDAGGGAVMIDTARDRCGVDSCDVGDEDGCSMSVVFASLLLSVSLMSVMNTPSLSLTRTLSSCSSLIFSSLSICRSLASMSFDVSCESKLTCFL